MLFLAILSNEQLNKHYLIRYLINEIVSRWCFSIILILVPLRNCALGHTSRKCAIWVATVQLSAKAQISGDPD